MKKLAVLVLTALTVVVAVLALWLSSTAREKDRLELDRQRAASEVERTEAKVAALQSALAAAQTALAEAAALTNQLQAALAASNSLVNLARANETPTNSPATNRFTPRPYQVRAYLGTQYVGMAWAIPSNMRRDTKTGFISYDQVVQLSPEARGALTEYVTNVFEQPVPVQPQQFVEQNYYVDRRPWWVWPSTVIVPPVNPGPPANPTRPALPSTPIHTPGQPYRPPGVGDRGLYVPPSVR